jgi:hypothetical protein
MRGYTRSVAVLMAGALLLAACGDGDDDANGGIGEGTGEDISGASVSIFGAPTSVEQDAINAVIQDHFNEPTGANAIYEGSDDFEQQVRIRIRSPMGSWSGKRFSATVWPMITTLRLLRRSSSSNQLPSITGQFRMIKEERGPNPSFVLPPGNYILCIWDADGAAVTPNGETVVPDLAASGAFGAPDGDCELFTVEAGIVERVT